MRKTKGGKDTKDIISGSGEETWQDTYSGRSREQRRKRNGLPPEGRIINVHSIRPQVGKGLPPSSPSDMLQVHVHVPTYEVIAVYWPDTKTHYWVLPCSSEKGSNNGVPSRETAALVLASRIVRTCTLEYLHVYTYTNRCALAGHMRRLHRKLQQRRTTAAL